MKAAEKLEAKVETYSSLVRFEIYLFLFQYFKFLLK